MKIGYIRISTQDQNYNLQEDALNKLGCEMIFKETVSGAKKERPQLKKLLEASANFCNKNSFTEESLCNERSMKI